MTMVDHLRAGAVARLADLARGRAGRVDAVVVAPALDQAEAPDADGLVGAVALGVAPGHACSSRKTNTKLRAIRVGVARLRAGATLAVR